MDLRTEPIVVIMPKIEENRYYSGQMIDLYTYNFAYLGTRSYGNDGGTFLVAGPGWTGETPRVLRRSCSRKLSLLICCFAPSSLIPPT